VTVFLLIVVFVPMFVEARRAARNERTQRQRGGVEPPGDVYALMRVAYPAAFLLMLGEGLWRHAWDEPPLTALTALTALTGLTMPTVTMLMMPPMRLIGLVVFVAAKALKWWAIVALGPCWTFRVVVVPGAPRIVGGPYAYLRHPNYVAVVLELAAVALMSGASVSGPVATLAFGVLIMKRMSVEERALRQAQEER
jgi:isoprenylcysteine carboxyl methyltransferase (ICMT) family protein YpbQ